VHNRAVARIREVRGLRAAQFPEDAGPMAHPVRPSSYVEINNFYTATVYEKGAEVVRMIQTLLGREAFRRGMDLYFQRHDGQAVTCDDFVAAMADASGADLGQFMRWYSQPGTPRVSASGRYDAAAKRYVLKLSQAPGATSGEAAQAWHIPVAVGLVGPDGADLAMADGAGTEVLSLTEMAQEFVFEPVPVAPVPSLLRNFSAPVMLDFPYTDEELAHLMAHDSDPFNRWEAGQRLSARLILAATATLAAGGVPQWPERFAQAAARVLADADKEPAFAAEALTLPSEATLAEQLDEVNPDALHAARNGLAAFLTERLGAAFRACYDASALTGPYRFDARDAGLRALRNLCLRYLTETDSQEGRALALAQFRAADNMTDQFAALSALAQCTGPERATALSEFHDRWQAEALVLDKWLGVQAGSRLPGTLAEVERLTAHPAFDMKNPNKVYALWRGFGANHVRFHAADGSGYRFMADRILLLDPMNPQVAARLARTFDRWKRFDPSRQAHARAALERIRSAASLSPDVSEIVSRALA
jgi:aminopeptidase N